MNNFCLSAYLASPIILTGGWMTLDAVLAAAIFRRTENPQRAHNEIPLARTDGIWHGSALFAEVEQNGSGAHFIRSLSNNELENPMWLPKRGKAPYYVDQSRDVEPYQWRRRDDSYLTFESSKVSWFGHGDMAAVKSLFDELPGIGKKTSHGYGALERIEISEIREDRSFMLHNGLPARPLPLEIWKSISGDAAASCRQVSVAPPYFNGDRVDAVVPEKRFLTTTELRRNG